MLISPAVSYANSYVLASLRRCVMTPSVPPVHPSVLVPLSQCYWNSLVSVWWYFSVSTACAGGFTPPDGHELLLDVEEEDSYVLQLSATNLLWSEGTRGCQTPPGAMLEEEAVNTATQSLQAQNNLLTYYQDQGHPSWPLCCARVPTNFTAWLHHHIRQNNPFLSQDKN